MGPGDKNPRVDGSFLRKLLEHPGCEEALETLEAGGAKRDLVVPLLRATAMCPTGRRHRILPDSKELKRASARMQRTGEDIASYNVHAVLGLNSVIFDPSLKVLFEALPLALASYSHHLQSCARRVADLGKSKPGHKKLLKLNLLNYVRICTGDYHYEEIALLMTAAEAAQGGKQTTEPSALKMLVRRNMRWTRSWFIAAAKSPKPEPSRRKHLTLGDRIAGQN